MSWRGGKLVGEPIASNPYLTTSRSCKATGIAGTPGSGRTARLGIRDQGGPNSAKWRRVVVAPPPLSRAGLVSRLGERDGHVALAVGGLHAHEHTLLALALGAREPGLYVLRRRHRLARDVENDVACGQAFRRSRAIWINADDGDALVASAGDLICASERNAERGGSLVLCRVGVFRICRDRRGFMLAEHRLEGLFGIVAHEGQLDLVARLEGVDAAGEVSGIFDRLPVQLRDDVAGLEARLSGRRAGYRL